MLELTSQQVTQLKTHGLTEKGLAIQKELLEKGSHPLVLHSPALIGNGISRLSPAEEESALSVYERITTELDILKFVPASGAATRMFKSLLAFYHGGERCPVVSRFFQSKRSLPFWKEDYDSLGEMQLLDVFFDSNGLNLADQPKGSILFHRYANEARTSFEEQMREGIEYAKGKDGIRIHFTIPHAQREAVEEKIQGIAKVVAKDTSTEIDVDCSVQPINTDTICMDSKGELFTYDNGDVFLRPGGHGALLQSLNRSQADLIFIKNIDNVCVAHKNESTVRYKKILAGRLIQLRQEAREMTERIQGGSFDHEAFDALMLRLGVDLKNKQLDAKAALALLDRPYRVCGMVRNEGEPGGGPFWVNDANGNTSLQIVESAQMNQSDAAQQAISKAATHFNPVDIVCCTKTLAGQPIDLLAHRDMASCFVTNKTVQGQELTVLEWPGLWNGSMADWNTLFVEVPLSTFNPVKTVNDLFRPAHQG